MSGIAISGIIGIALTILVALFGTGMIMAKLYTRASKEISFVRTGLGGQKVIMNGGALVIPILQDVIPVNMNTLRLEVSRCDDHALITKDRMRVDVQAEFYVRVKPMEDAIADAAQTLGLKTMDPAVLKELVEGKFVDALRSVAAEMAMESLHEHRVDFVQKVQKAVSEDLLKNGLELESVCLTGLNQTNRKFLNPENVFDAQGMTKLTEQIEARRKQRNDIEQDTEVQIRTKNLEAERLKLDVARDQEYARLEQEREVSIRTVAQAAEIAREKAEKEQQSRQAQILAQQQVDQSTILAEKGVTEQNIQKEREIKQREIEKQRTIEAAEIERRKVIELAEQEREIAIAQKSREQSEAKAQADLARALAVKASEQVETAKQKEIFERDREISLVEARKKAEMEALGVTISAEAERKAAEDRAAAITILAQAEAGRILIAAEAEAKAASLKAEASSKTWQAEAEGKRLMHTADNILASEQISMHVKMALIKQLPDIIRESVKPMEKIDGIKIVQVEGLNAGGVSSGSTSGSGDGNLANQVVNSALRYRAQAPLVDSLLKELGLSTSDINGLTRTLNETSSDQNKPA